MQIARPLFTQFTKHSPRFDGLYNVHRISEGIAVMDVGRHADYGEWNSFGFDHNMALRDVASCPVFLYPSDWAGTFAPF